MRQQAFACVPRFGFDARTLRARRIIHKARRFSFHESLRAATQAHRPLLELAIFQLRSLRAMIEQEDFLRARIEIHTHAISHLLGIARD